MSDGLILLSVVLAGVAALGGLGWMLRSAYRKSWRVPVNGHEVVVENDLFGERLRVDGRVVARTHGVTESQLRAQVDGRPLVAWIHTAGGMKVVAQVFFDGKLVGGDPLLGMTPATAAGEEDLGEEWAGADTVLRRLAQLAAGEERAQRVVEDLRAELRRRLIERREISRAIDAGRAFAEAGDETASVRAQANARVKDLLERLQRLHLKFEEKNLRQGTSLDDELDAVMRDLAVDSEISRAAPAPIARKLGDG